MNATNPSRWHGSKNAAGQLASIEKVFAFADFDTALAFANGVALIAQQHNHHPSILLQWGALRGALEYA